MSAPIVKRWRVSDSAPIPVLVDCEGSGEWPDIDADGNVIYENTHFVDERDAWAYALKSVEAMVRLEAASIATAERHLDEARARMREGLKAKGEFVRAFEPRRRELWPSVDGDS